MRGPDNIDWKNEIWDAQRPVNIIYVAGFK